MRRTTTRAVLRGTAVCCALGNAAVHLTLTPDHLEEKLYIGVLFLVGSLVMILVAVGLSTRRGLYPAWLIGTMVSLGMIISFALSRSVGLPGYHEESWEPPYGPLSLIVEGVFILAFLGWLAAGEGERRPALRPRRAPAARVPSGRPG